MILTRGARFHLVETVDRNEVDALLDRCDGFEPMAPTVANDQRVYRGRMPATPGGELDIALRTPLGNMAQERPHTVFAAPALSYDPHAARGECERIGSDGQAFLEPEDGLPAHLRNSQANAVRWHRLAHRGLVHGDMGTGKSAIGALRACDYPRTLILCPKAVIPHWPRQFEKHTDAPVTVYTLAKGTSKKKAEVAADAWHTTEDLARAASGESAVLVVNYESVWRDALGKFLEAYPPDLLILDEVQKVKSRGGVASKWVAKLTYENPDMSVLGLSGTPCPQAPEDAFGVWRSIDVGIYGRHWTRFQSRYFQTKPVPGHCNAQMIVGMKPEATDRFRRRFDRLTFRIRAEDTLDLPAVTHITREIELPPRVMAQYRQLRDDLVFDLDCDPPITADNALTKLLRLRQLTGGSIGTGDEMKRVHHAKQENLEALFDELPPSEPVVVFCQFRADLAAVAAAAQKVGRDCRELSGKANELDEWQQEKGGEVLAVQIQAGGAGVELVRARHCVYFSLGFSLGDYEQSLARVHRPGQERRVFYHHLIATDTVDELVYRALAGRREVLDDVLEAIREGGDHTS